MRPAPDILIRVVFELQFRGKDRVSSVQGRISSFAGSRFQAVVKESLSGMAKERLLIFDRVELDVGKVSLARLEDDLAAGIARCLRRWAFTVKPSQSRPLQLSPGETSTHWRDESWPQIARKRANSAAAGLNAAVAVALQEPADWSEFAAALRDNYALRCRLADEVSPKLLRRLISALVPDQDPWIADFAEDAARLHERHPLLSINNSVFRRALWECVFSELARSQGSSLNRRSFIQNVLRRVAVRYSRPHSEIAQNLALALQRHSTRPAIRELLAEAAAELKPETAEQRQRQLPSGWLPESSSSSLSAATDTQADLTVSGVSRRLDDLAKFLELGVLPWSLMHQDAQAEMIELLASTPDSVCTLVRSLSTSPSVRKRISGQLSEAANNRLLAALAPTAAGWMISYMRQMRRLHAQRPLFPVRNREFARELWDLAYEYLGHRKWQTFDPRSFLQFLLLRLAARRKTSYESLLADLTLRRGPESHSQGVGKTPEAATSFAATLLTLFDEAISGLSRRNGEPPRFLIQPQYRHLYCDLDVLAYWLRWQRLPSWSHAINPEDTGKRLGSLLRDLPREVRPGVRKRSTRLTAVADKEEQDEVTSQLSTAEQLGRWLDFGLWPNAVPAPDQAQLALWLEKQSDADWLKALEAAGTEVAVIERISRHLSSAFLERITLLLGGHTARLALDYIHFLDHAGRHTAPVATQIWQEQLRKHTLMYLLRASSASGHHAISMPDMARDITLALALNCRVSYERLVDAVEQESRGREAVQKLCHELRQELDAAPGEIKDAYPPGLTAHEAARETSPDSVEVLAQYLKHASLPESFQHITFPALQRMAELLSDDQMSSLARACAGEAVTPAKARRIVTLFSREDFIRFAHPRVATVGVISELESALSVLAARLSTRSTPLLSMARISLLRHPSAARVRTAEVNVMKAVLSEVIPQIATLTGADEDTVWKEMKKVAKDNTLLSKTLAEAGHVDAPTAEDVEAKDGQDIDTQPGGGSLGEPEQGRIFRSATDSARDDGGGNATSSAMPFNSSLTEEMNSSGVAESAPWRIVASENVTSDHLAGHATQAPASFAGTNAASNEETTIAPTLSPAARGQSHPQQPAAAFDQQPESRHMDANDIRGRLTALSHFLRSGRLPWWAENLARLSSQDWISVPLAQAPESLLETLRAASSQPGVLQRLMRHVAKRELEQMVRVAEPEGGELLLLYICVGSGLAEAGDASLTSIQHSQAASVHWQETLALLLNSRPPRLSAPEIVRQLVGSVSRALGVTRDRYTAALLRIARRTSGDSHSYAALAEALEPLTPKAVAGINESQKTASVSQAVATSEAVPGAKIPTLGELEKHKSAVESDRVPITSQSDPHAESSAESDPSVANTKNEALPGAVAAHDSLNTADEISAQGQGEKQIPRCARNDKVETVSEDQAGTLSQDETGTLSENKPEALSGDQPVPLSEDKSGTLFSGKAFNRKPGSRSKDRVGTPSEVESTGPANLPDETDTTEVIASDRLGSEAHPGEDAGAEDSILGETVAELPAANDVLQQLDYLLRYGDLPEGSPTADRENLIARVIEEANQHPAEYRRYLLVAAGRELERKRMARLLPASSLVRLWPLILPAHHAEAIACLELLEETVSIAASGRASDSHREVIVGESQRKIIVGKSQREMIVGQLLQSVATSQGHRWDCAPYLRSTIERLAERLSLRSSALIKQARAVLENKPDDLKKKLQPAIDRVELETSRMPKLRQARPLQPEGHMPRIQQPARASRRMPEGEPFYINNAGVILLWPFLQTYFQKLGMLEKNAFRDEAAQSRAIYLVQHLASGTIDAPEQQLLLNKILAGAGPEQPLETPAPITEAEETLSRQLLQGVLQNWAKLKNTSVEGLRASFLMREGKLLLKDDAWSLTVSHKGFDMLLDSLPWRLTPVRLPWMKAVLHVKWR